jgi:hypothetical protein
VGVAASERAVGNASERGHGVDPGVDRELLPQPVGHVLRDRCLDAGAPEGIAHPFGGTAVLTGVVIAVIAAVVAAGAVGTVGRAGAVGFP